MKLEVVKLRRGDKQDHPDINCRSWYLAKIVFEGETPIWMVGKFSRQWYGLHFDCDWGASGIQFDTPGTNMSPWKGLWRIVA